MMSLRNIRAVKIDVVLIIIIIILTISTAVCEFLKEELNCVMGWGMPAWVLNSRTVDDDAKDLLTQDATTARPSFIRYSWDQRKKPARPHEPYIKLRRAVKGARSKTQK